MGLSITKRVASFASNDRAGQRNWKAIKEEFVTLKANGSSISLKEFGAKKHIGYPFIRQKASEGKWTQAIEDRIRDVDARVSEQMVQRSADAISSVRQALASDESEVRERHAKIARDMQGKAVRRLNEIPISELSPREAIDLLRIGMEQERRALGIPDEQRLEINGQHHIVVSREQEIFEQHLLVHQNVQKAVSEAIKLLEDKSNASRN
jgi:hypothetical protein